MKATRFLTLILALALLLPFAVTPVNAYALVSVQVGDRRLAFGYNTPVIDANGRTLVPLAKIATALNIRTDWEDATKTVTFTLDYWVYDYPFSDPVKGTLTDATMIFKINDNTFIHEQVWDKLDEPEVKQITMDTAPRIIDSRTYAPVRYLAEAAGYDVHWDAENRTVVLNLQGTERHEVIPAKSGNDISVSDIGKKYSNYWFDFTVNSIWSGESYNGFRADPGHKFYVFSVTQTNTFIESLPLSPAIYYMEGDDRTDIFQPIYMPGEQFMPIAFTLDKKETATYLLVFEIPDSRATENLDFCYTEHAEDGYFRYKYVVDVY